MKIRESGIKNRPIISSKSEFQKKQQIIICFFSMTDAESTNDVSIFVLLDSTWQEARKM